MKGFFIVEITHSHIIRKFELWSNQKRQHYMSKSKPQFSTRKKAMLEALAKSMGIVSTAAKQAKIDRTLHYRWLKSDPEYRIAVAELDNIALDFAESKLHDQIKNDNVTATIFYLKTKGKARGYVERNEVDLSGDFNTAFSLNIK